MSCLRLNLSSLAKVILSVLLVPVLAAPVFAQDDHGSQNQIGQNQIQQNQIHQNQEKTFADSWLPLVFPVENTAAGYPAPNFPSFADLPIIRPLPDACTFPRGWARRWS